MGTLESLAEAVDVLSLHADLNDSNERMIDEKVLGLMGEQSVLVNTARGQLVDEDALLDALHSGRIAEDTFGDGNRLLDYARRHDNLVLTPHIGGQTEEAVEAADRHILKKIDQWCQMHVN